MSKRTKRGLRANGHAVTNKLGLFKVPKGTRDMSLISYSAEATKKYIAHFEKAGWRLESRPKVRRIRFWEEDYRVVLDQRGATLAVPTSTGMRDDHPWFISDADQYRVTADWSQPHRRATFEIADKTLTRLVEKGLLPAGMEVH